MKRLSPLVALFVGIVFLFSAPLSAADPLETLPGDTAVVVRIQSVEGLLNHISDMLGAINPAALQVMPSVNEAIAESFNLRIELTGLDQSQPAYLALLPLPGKQPATVWLVRASDEKKLRQSLMKAKDGEALQVTQRDDGFAEVSREGAGKFYLAKRGDYTMYTRREDALVSLAQAGKDEKSLAKIMTPRASKLLGQGDIGVFVNAAMLVKRYQTEIESARQSVLQFIKDLPDEQLNVASPEAIRNLYSKGADIFFDAVLDSTWVVGGAGFNAIGAESFATVDFKQESKTSKLLAANVTSPFDNLGLLPAGAGALFGYKFGENTVNADYLQSTFGAADAQRKKAFDKALQLMRAAKVLSVVSGFSLPRGGKTGMATTTIEESKDAQKLRQGTAEIVGAMSTVKTPYMDQTMTYQRNAETYKGKAIDLLVVKFSFGEGEQADIVRNMIKAMFGGTSKYEARLTTVENLLVQVGGNDPKGIQQALDNMESGEGVVGLQDTYAKTRDHLAEESNLIGMLDLARLSVDGMNMVRDVPPFGGLIGVAPFNLAAKPAPSYTGFSLGGEPHAVRMKMFVPIEQPKGILQIFVPGL